MNTSRFLATLVVVCSVFGSAYALPPQVEADMLLKEIGDAVKANQLTGLADKFQRVNDLKAKVQESFEFHWGRTAYADQDYEGAMLHLDRYLTASGSSGKYYVDALDLYTKAKKQATAERQRKASQDLLVQARVAMKRYGETHDTQSVLQPLQRAAEMGLADAQLDLGVGYLESNWGLARDGALAKKWLEAAARQNKPEAEMKLGFMYELARLYKYGDGLAALAGQDESRRWYQLAADHGVAAAWIKLGDLADDDKNVQEAIRFYKQAATLGDKNAYDKVAWRYYNNLKDYREAATWWWKAAQELDGVDKLQALEYLGMAYDGYDNLSGTRSAYKRGVEAAQKMGSQEYLKTFYFALGESFRIGYVNKPGGVDLQEARQWYQKGAEMGDAKCIDALKQF